MATLIYRYCVEIEARSQKEAEQRLEELVAQEGWGFDLEGTEAPEDDDRCDICGRELDPDDHKTSEHGDGYAHDACIAEEG